jgi:hypothetical protein
MSRHNDTVDQVRTLLGPANPVPATSNADSWQDPSARDLRARIEAQAQSDSGPSPAGSRPGGRLARSGRLRVLAPVAAGLAVALIVGLTLAAGSATHQRPSTPSAAGRTAGSAGMPKFYVAVDLKGTGNVVAQVRSSQTGQILSSRHIGAYGNGIGIAADGKGDRSFLIYAGDHNISRKYTERLWRLTLSANGKSTTLHELPLVLLPARSYDVVDGIAVSPDGTRLAVALQLQDKQSLKVNNSHMEMLVYSLTGGATQTWTAPSDVAVAWSPAWTSNSDLTFVWQDHLTGSPEWFTGASQVRVLDTSKPSRDLLSSTVIATGGGSIGFIQTAVAGPNDSPVIGATYRDVSAADGSGTATLRLVGLTPAGVSTVYVTSNVHYSSKVQMQLLDNSCQILAADNTGQNELASCPAFGRIDNGTFTPLPGNAGIESAAW